MRKNIHPEYRPIVFRDRSAGTSFLSASTLTSDQTIEWTDGRILPVVDVQISSASHPFWTGKARTIDTEGRLERFQRRYGAGRSEAGRSGDGEEQAR